MPTKNSHNHRQLNAEIPDRAQTVGKCQTEIIAKAHVAQCHVIADGDDQCVDDDVNQVKDQRGNQLF